MFKFRLAKILRLREHQEKLCLEKVGQCNLELHEALQKKEEMAKEITRFEADFVLILKGVLSAERMGLYQKYLLYLCDLMSLQEETIEHKKYNLEEAKRKLVQAMRQRKILDKLREKQYLRYQQEQKEKEQYLQDELAITSKRR